MSGLLFDLFDYDAIIKECKKKYGLKKKEDHFWLIRDDILFHFWPRLQRIDGRFRLYAGIFFKPLYADEIRWELFSQMTYGHMYENFSYKFNAEQPISHRIIGLPGPEKIIHDEWVWVDCGTTEELQIAVEKVIEEQLKIIEGITEEDYRTETALSMINIFRAIRHNDYMTAWRLIWKIKSQELGWWYDIKKVSAMDRPYNKTPDDEGAIDCYYLYKEPLLVFVLKNKKRMKKNIKENRLFEVPGKEALMQTGQKA
ncbi:MAG: hypothetical protein IKO03_12955 [Lachnospiraceae bacterium]|nr:hypothetical protein [Lachnospiraceae bacterium]